MLGLRPLVVAAIAAAGVPLSTGPWIGGPVEALDVVPPFEIVRVDTFSPTTPAILDVSPDGRFAIVRTDSFEQMQALPGPERTSLVATGHQAHDGGTFAFRVGGVASIVRTRVADGSADEIPVPLPAGMHLESIADADGSGRVFLLTAIRAGAGSGNPRNVYVYDSTSGDLTLPFGDRLGAIDPPPSPRGLSPDARYVLANDFLWSSAPAIPGRILLDRASGVIVRRWEPLGGLSADGFPFRTSDDLRWSLFVSDAADVMPGLPAGRRLYRTDHLLGSVVAVPVDVSSVSSYSIHDGGRVLVAHTLPEHPDALQVSVWDGTGDLLLVTRGVDGEPADEGVLIDDLAAVAAADGSRITFRSASTNLVDGVPAGVQLYHVALPVAPPQRAAVPVGPDTSLCVQVPGAEWGDVVGVNATVVGATAPGFGVVHSSDTWARGISTVNFGPGIVDPNVTYVRAGLDRRVCYTNSTHGSAHVVLDAMVLADGEAFRDATPFGPVRVLDTRSADPVAPSGSVCIDLHQADSDALPGEFVGLNITPVQATAAGYATAHASGASPEASSTVNFAPGTVDPNFAFVPVGEDGGICITNSVHGSVHLAVDLLVVGSVGALSSPGDARPVDTRIGLGGSTLAASGSVCWVVAGGSPGDYAGVNLTPVNALSPGFGVLHSSDDEPGSISNVAFGPGSVDPNHAIARVGGDGRVCFTNSVHGPVDLVVDSQVLGMGGVFRPVTATGAVRLVDTRTAS